MLTEANVLYGLLDNLPALDRPSALNVVAWIHQNRKSLFSSLPASTYDAALVQMYEALGTSDSELAAHTVDTEAARKAIRLFLPDMNATFMRAAAMHTPEVTQVLFECWKSLTGEDDLACYAKLLSVARAQMLLKTKAPLGSARQLVEEARAALKKSIEPNMNLSAALELHKELLRFIDTLTEFGAMPEWAMTTLEEMASDPASHVPRQAHPNAAAWPFWFHAQMSLKKLSSDRCLPLLKQCAALDGVVADDHLDSLFAQGIRLLLADVRDEHGRQALQAFKIWQSVPRGPHKPEDALMPLGLLTTLVSNLRQAIIDRVYTGVDVQQTMHALMAQLLIWDPAGARVHLDAILASPSARRAHPRLGTDLCMQFAQYFSAKKDAAQEMLMRAKAFMNRPVDPQQPLGHAIL